MADVIHRTTLEFRGSAHTPDFPEPTWKHSPNMTAVSAVPSRYWKAPLSWDGDVGPVEMTQPEKDTVDSDLATAAADAASTEADEGVGGQNDAGWQSIRQVLRENNQDHNKMMLRLREIEQALNDMKGTATLAALRNAIPDPSLDTGGPAPTEFTRTQDRDVSNFVSEYRQALRDAEGQV